MNAMIMQPKFGHVFLHMQDHVGQEVGVWFMIKQVRVKAFNVGAGLAKYLSDRDDWKPYTKTGPKYMEPQNCFETLAEAEAWLAERIAQIEFDVTAEPGFYSTDVRVPTPNELAEKLGAVSLKHLSAMTGIKETTLKGIHRDYLMRFHALCVGVAIGDYNGKDKRAV